MNITTPIQGFPALMGIRVSDLMESEADTSFAKVEHPTRREFVMLGFKSKR